MNLQLQTLRLYGELVSRRESWAGRLVFACGQGAASTGLAAAASLAGGTSLVVDADVPAVKAVMRQGGVDFVVNTLDEALRVLKNEVRQGRPLGVALTAEPALVLAEMRERGVLPDMRIELEVASLALPDVETLVLNGGEVAVTPSEHLAAWLQARRWMESVSRTASTAELRSLDAERLASLAPEDRVRRQWIQRISHYIRPANERVLWASVSPE